MKIIYNEAQKEILQRNKFTQKEVYLMEKAYFDMLRIKEANGGVQWEQQ